MMMRTIIRAVKTARRTRSRSGLPCKQALTLERSGYFIFLVVQNAMDDFCAQHLSVMLTSSLPHNSCK
jgi:hypothetical protein